MTTHTIAYGDFTRTPAEDHAALERAMVAIETGHFRGEHGCDARYHLHAADIRSLERMECIEVEEQTHGVVYIRVLAEGRAWTDELTTAGRYHDIAKEVVAAKALPWA